MENVKPDSVVKWGREQIIAVFALILPALAACLGIFQVVSGEASRFDLSLFLIFFVLTMYGVEAGFHRFMSHASFKTSPLVKSIHIILGSAAIQGPVLFWVAIHRQHHAHEDTSEDPHSPRTEDTHLWSQILASFHGHIGWLFSARRPEWGKYAADLLKDRLVLRLNQLYPLFVLGGLALPALMGWLYYGTVVGAWQGLLWGGLIRVFMVHHSVWAVNSICHLVGTRPYLTKGMSTNNILLSVVTMGGSWHNNHHAFQYTAYNSFKWYQIDLCGIVIKTLHLLKVVHSVKFPSKELRHSRLKQNLSQAIEEVVSV